MGVDDMPDFQEKQYIADLLYKHYARKNFAKGKQGKYIINTSYNSLLDKGDFMRLFNKDPLANAKKYGYSNRADIALNNSEKVNKYRLDKMGWARTVCSKEEEQMIAIKGFNTYALDMKAFHAPTDFEVFLYKKNKFYEHIIHLVALSMLPKTIYGIITIISWI